MITIADPIISRRATGVVVELVVRSIFSTAGALTSSSSIGWPGLSRPNSRIDVRAVSGPGRCYVATAAIPRPQRDSAHPDGQCRRIASPAGGAIRRPGCRCLTRRELAHGSFDHRQLDGHRLSSRRNRWRELHHNATTSSGYCYSRSVVQRPGSAIVRRMAMVRGPSRASSHEAVGRRVPALRSCAGRAVDPGRSVPRVGRRRSDRASGSRRSAGWHMIRCARRCRCRRRLRCRRSRSHGAGRRELASVRAH